MAKNYQIHNPANGAPYDVSDEPMAGYSEAPEPWRSIWAAFWKTSPFMQWPWVAFPVEAVDHNVKQKQFERVQGIWPQRRDWVAQGGSNADFNPGLVRYGQDYDLFNGIIEPDAPLAAALASHQGMWDAHALGKAGCYLFVNRRGDAQQQAERPEITNLFFESAALPPPASKQSGRLKWRAEDVTVENLSTNAVLANQIVADYQKALVFGGIYVPKLHPHAQYLAARNDALAPKG
jgi:hypothetical protein